MPDWTKWSIAVSEFAVRSLGGNLLSQISNAFLKSVLTVHTEEMTAILNVAKTDREGYYKSALLQVAEATRTYTSALDRREMLASARQRLFDCIARSEKGDPFLAAMAAACLADIHLLLGNVVGASEWYDKATSLSKTAVASALRASLQREKREGLGGNAGIGLGLGLGIAVAIVCAPLGAVSPAVQLIGTAALQLGTIGAAAGLGGAAAHVAGKTIPYPYDVHDIRNFRHALLSINASALVSQHIVDVVALPTSDSEISR